MWGVVSWWRWKVVLHVYCISDLKKINKKDPNCHRVKNHTKDNQCVLIFNIQTSGQTCTWPKVIFLSFTFLCLLSLHTLMYLFCLSLFHSLSSYSSSSSSSSSLPLVCRLGWQDKRSGIAAYILPLSPQILTLHTLHCSACSSLISWFQVLVSLM